MSLNRLLITTHTRREGSGDLEKGRIRKSKLWLGIEYRVAFGECDGISPIFKYPKNYCGEDR